MDLLKNSGFDFEKHKTQGIPSKLFAEYLMTSGLFMNQNIKWITFNGGVDFAYLMKYLSGCDLPNDETAFFEFMDAYFCNYFDIKEMKRDID